MDSINALNNSGINAQESISEAAKQNSLLAQQLANQKKEEINEPLNMLGAELLTGSTTDALKLLGKKVASRTGIKSFEKLGTEDLGKTLQSVGKELQKNVIKKGGEIIKDKVGTKIDDLMTRGKKYALNAINRELNSRGVPLRIREDDLNNIENLKDTLRQKVLDYKNQAINTVKNQVAEKGEELRNAVNNVKNDIGADDDLISSIQNKITQKYGKAPKSIKEKIQDDIRSKQSNIEKTAKRVKSQQLGRDVGEGIDDADKKTQKILGDLQESKGKNLIKQRATKHYKFADEKIQNVNRQIDNLPESRKPEPVKTEPEPVGQQEEVFKIGKDKPKYQQEDDVNELFDEFDRPVGKGAVDPVTELQERDARKIEQQQIKANIQEVKKDTTPDFKQKRITESELQEQRQAQRDLEQQQLDQLPSLEELTETPDQKIIRLQRERVDRGIRLQAENDLGKRPSELYKPDPKIRDPTTLGEGEGANLGKTSARVEAKVSKKEADVKQPDPQKLPEPKPNVEGDIDFDPAQLPPPPAELEEPEKQALQLQETQISEPKVTPTTLGQQAETELQKQAPLVQKSETTIEPEEKPKVPKIEADIEEGEEALGGADIAAPEDVFGDIGEAILGIASLVLPSALEKSEDLGSHNALFSSSFQAGQTA